MKKKLPIGVSEFKTVITDNGYYVDKTLLIEAWLQTISGNVTLITRPRRFGKTLNMTMLREFFDITQDSRLLFEGLAISQTPYVSEMNSRPVIYLSFKDCKGEKNEMLRCLFRQLLAVYEKSYEDLAPGKLDGVALERIVAVLLNEKVAEDEVVNDSILFLSKLLYKHYGQKAVILIDEYDTPMISAYEGGYYEDVRSFFRSLYGSALKDNPYLERAMLTGIHRIAKENIFSELNNLEVCTVIDKMYSQYFGLTPEETEALLQAYDLALDQAVKDMYDGYRFGGQEIYNPWSILNYVDKKRLVPYWVNTASNDILLQAITATNIDSQHDLETLLAQGQARVPVDLQTSFFEIAQTATLWGLFLNSGYLTVAEETTDMFGLQTVRIPNQEVMTSFKKLLNTMAAFPKTA